MTLCCTVLFICLGKKKKGKSKSKTVSLNEFLSSDGSTPPMPMRTKSWADETNDLEDEGMSPVQ